jgi:membrane protein
MNFKKAKSLNGRKKFNKMFLPGFHDVPLKQVISFVIKGFQKGVLVTRASSIAFNLLLALLPASIFTFTLIPFVPVPNFQMELIKLFENILPTNAFDFLQTTIIDVVTHKSSGLLLIMFFATVIFSTNGIHAVINAFVVSSHTFKSRSWFNQRKISIVLLLIVLFMIGIAGFLVIFGKIAVTRLVKLHILKRHVVIYFLIFLKWIVVILILFMAISFLYYLAPARRTGFKFFSPGSIIATLLFILTSLGFSAYVNNFGQYNKLYGSMGTIMVMLIWLYLNSIAILIGFELNLSIMEAQAEDEKKSSGNQLQ